MWPFGTKREARRPRALAVTARAWLRGRMRGSAFFLVPLAILIGVIAGVIVTLMSEAAQLAHVAIYGIRIDVRLSANDTVNPIIALIGLTAGGLALGWMEYYRRKANISTATDPIEANALRGGRLSLRDSIVVSVQTLISNGCGASVGLEAGYTQIGSGLASLFGRRLNLRRADLRLMVGSGAAAAIAAAFNAPLTGAFYACELIVGVYSVASAAPILAAAISATLVSQWLGGTTYALDVPHVVRSDATQYALMIVLALFVSAIGILIMRAAPLVEKVFNHDAIPVMLRPVIGGLCIGCMTLITPQILAAGHGAMVLDLARNMSITFILTIIVLKITACLISLASGFRGGLFFASLFVGSLLGKLFSSLLSLPMLGLHLDPTTSALTAMASLGVAIVGGPLTMSFLVLEMTRSLELTAGVLGACIVTSIVVRELFGYSFSTWRLHLRGETIRSANDIGWLRNLTVERLMSSDAAMERDNASIKECRQRHPLGTTQAIFLLDKDDRYAGTVLMADLFSSDYDIDADRRRVSDLAKYTEMTLTPGMNIRAAMDFFDQAEAEVLAVVVDGVINPAIVGFLSESFARRRYAEEIEQATAGVFR